MLSNILKLLFVSIILAIITFFVAQQLLPSLNTSATADPKLFATGTAVSALLAAFITGVFLLIRPYQLPIRKTTLFVGNLAFKASDRDLRNLFSQCGEVFSIRLMTDRVTRKPRGYGFIEMDNAGAKRAMSELNETEFLGREIRVSLANEPQRQERD